MSREDYADQESFLRDDYTDAADFSRAATRQEVAELRTLVRVLERRLEREAAIVSALTEVLGEVLDLKGRTLLEQIGEALGRQPDPRDKRCPQCRQFVPVRSHRCIYCGADRVIESAADLLWAAATPGRAGRNSAAHEG